MLGLIAVRSCANGVGFQSPGAPAVRGAPWHCVAIAPNRSFGNRIGLDRWGR